MLSHLFPGDLHLSSESPQKKVAFKRKPELMNDKKTNIRWTSSSDTVEVESRKEVAAQQATLVWNRHNHVENI